jgi:hypothetical protein
MGAIRDSNVSRNYHALKLASWLTEKSYWQGGLTERQVMWLINRTLNHDEVQDRWGDIDVDVTFADTGNVAWALPGKTPQLFFPANAYTPLIILHEVAHLLKTAKREADHGPGFTATHLMLIELVKPQLLQPMLAAYEACCTPWDASRIPQGKSNYIPLVGSVQLTAARHQLQALLASGIITEKERRQILTVIKNIQVTQPPALRSMPAEIRVRTENLLACNTDKDIAKLVLNSLAEELQPKEMKRPLRGKKIT